MAEPKVMLARRAEPGSRAEARAGGVRRHRRGRRESGIPILLVEQNTRLALQTAHRAYVLVTGEIVLCGSATELREDSRIRAAYLGEDVHA